VTFAICEYGAGNVRSVELALSRLGARRIDDVEAADLAVLPGVGSARAAMTGLRERGHDTALQARMAAGRPILGVCLGLQLALDWTDEDGGVEGLSLIAGRAERLVEGRVPRMGWAAVEELGAFYFAHSYAAVTPTATRWSEGVVAEARLGAFVGCQFHPEKSGPAGARYLARVLEEARSLSLA
jgi:imidazole glycerol phosphate synthase glutamine amidotransferase subunit